MKYNKQIETALEVVNMLSVLGKAYIVGGAVRDLIMGNEIHDVDIATNVPMEKIEAMFGTYELGKNKDFGVLGIKHKDMTFEVAQFRTESVYSDGRHPDTVNLVDSITEDVLRRDFTINALAMNEYDDVLDLVGGVGDIRLRTIRAVGDPVKRFNEDYLRMLRAVRFAARFGFTIEEKTMESIQLNAHNILGISPERIWQEVFKAANGSSEIFANFISLLKESNLLEHVFPYIHGLVYLPHNKDVHPEGANVYEHTIAALKVSNSKNPITNLAILFHDIGKLYTMEIDKHGKYTYHGHDKEASQIIVEICDMYRVDNNTREALIFAAEHHMRFFNFPKMKTSKVYEIYSNKNFGILKDVCYADNFCRGLDTNNSEWICIIDDLSELDKKISGKNWDDEFKKVVNGKLVMTIKGIEPSPKVGKIIAETKAYVLDNRIDLNNKYAIIDFITNY